MYMLTINHFLVDLGSREARYRPVGVPDLLRTAISFRYGGILYTDEQQLITMLGYYPTELTSTSALALPWVRAGLYVEPWFLNSPSGSNHPDNLP